MLGASCRCCRDMVAICREEGKKKGREGLAAAILATAQLLASCSGSGEDNWPGRTASGGREGRSSLSRPGEQRGCGVQTGNMSSPR